MTERDLELRQTRRQAWELEITCNMTERNQNLETEQRQTRIIMTERNQNYLDICGR